MRPLVARLVLLTVLLAFASLAPLTTSTAEAHRHGCHRWHSCPSDNGSYVCGDLGYDDYCPSKPEEPPPPPPPTAQPLPAQPPAPPASGRPAVDWRTYETDVAFYAYWQRNGALPVFGFAKTPPYTEGGHIAQIFERNRLELHQENQPPYHVQLGLLGEERLLQLGRVWQNDPRAESKAGCRYFAETGHNLCEPFLSYWKAHGLEFDGKRGYSEAESLALFGFPITENENSVQWFQRARFEDHGAQGVLLGLLGNEVYGQ